MTFGDGRRGPHDREVPIEGRPRRDMCTALGARTRTKGRRLETQLPTKAQVMEKNNRAHASAIHHHREARRSPARSLETEGKKTPAPRLEYGLLFSIARAGVLSYNGVIIIRAPYYAASGERREGAPRNKR